jgi:hypothetical protein
VLFAVPLATVDAMKMTYDPPPAKPGRLALLIERALAFLVLLLSPHHPHSH